MGGRALILIDTHVLVWLDQGAAALGSAARGQADEALRHGALAVSVISYWELATLGLKGRLGVRRPLGPWRRSLIEQGLVELPLDGEIALAAGAIKDLHGDPADRMIVATALHHGASLMTADRRLLCWSGPLKCLDARACLSSVA